MGMNVLSSEGRESSANLHLMTCQKNTFSTEEGISIGKIQDMEKSPRKPIYTIRIRYGIWNLSYLSGKKLLVLHTIIEQLSLDQSPLELESVVDVLLKQCLSSQKYH